MKLSVCVVHYHSEKDLEGFLQSFFDGAKDVSHEIIIIDNGSSVPDLEESLRHRFGQSVEVVRSPRNVGFGRAQNEAVRRAKGDYILLCNPDLRVREGSVQKLLQFADSLADFGVIGPQLLHPDGHVQESARMFPKPMDLLMSRLRFFPTFRRAADRYRMKDVNGGQSMEVDWLVGAALLMKRDRFLEVEGFDERFFLFFEDTDLCRRLKEKGYSVWYYPESSFVHPRLRLSDSRWPGMWIFKKTFWIHLASARKYFKKWGRGEGS